jgi:hypothetical protein
MKTIMTLNSLTTIDQLAHFLDGSQICAYQVQSSAEERYKYIQKTLVQFRYYQLKKQEKGVVIRYLMKISGYSRQQITRLIRQYRTTGKCERKQQTVRGFSRRYSDADIHLLSELDELHETPCGAVMKILCIRAHTQGDKKFEQLAKISASHIYNIRSSKCYQQKRRHFTKTQSKASSIGERRKPNAQGQPGYLRVDTVHQGDQDKQKGVYHINMVDEVTQFEICFAVEKISEQFLVGPLEVAIAKLPFKIRGFHSDNGSEYINKKVALMLGKLNIEFTKSRSRQSNDNALVESKNAAVIRKQFGYSHIEQHWAKELNQHLQEPMYRYLNFHRPCFFPVTIMNEKGKQIKKYLPENIMTPYERFLSLENSAQYLKPDVSIEQLQRYASDMTDQAAATALQMAKRLIFSKIFSATSQTG